MQCPNFFTSVGEIMPRRGRVVNNDPPKHISWWWGIQSSLHQEMSHYQFWAYCNLSFFLSLLEILGLLMNWKGYVFFHLPVPIKQRNWQCFSFCMLSMDINYVLMECVGNWIDVTWCFISPSGNYLNQLGVALGVVLNRKSKFKNEIWTNRI